MSQNTDKPTVAQYKPYRVQVEKGQRYLWCSCGLSQSQPFCDRSHEGTTFKPMAYQAETTKTVLFCGCKHSAGPPLCDGSHNDLADEYAEDERPLAELLDTTEEVPFDSSGRATLDGGCYVQRQSGLAWNPVGELEVSPVISTADGARFLSQYIARLDAGSSEVLCYPGGDVVLYCTSGEGEVKVSGTTFSLAPRTGIHVRNNEGFQLSCYPGETLQCLVTVCPGSAELEVLSAMPDNFDSNFANRRVQFDESQKVAMADRFYQVLVGEEMGSLEVTQFIGQIPKSKAAPHRHLYEEAILVLSASGTMWTETRRAAVEAGDLIFLPAEQEHSLQCTEDGGMELAGHFYPAGSPSINY
jgi:CDGSH-type Zn-finger protein/quercetin dioxygenase-like cupin family protein